MTLSALSGSFFAVESGTSPGYDGKLRFDNRDLSDSRSPVDTIVALPAEHCPICLGDSWRGKKKLLLYGQRVCRRCYYRVANRRQGAFVLDLVAVSVLEFVISAGAAIVIPPGTQPFMVLMWLIGGVGIVFFALRDGFSGQSPGKWICGLQVVDAQTMEPISFPASMKRNLPIMILQGSNLIARMITLSLALVSSLIVLVLYLVMAHQLNRGPRWGDGLAGTKVVWKAHRHRVPFDLRGRVCVRCGYDLRGTVSGICSECGLPIMQNAAPLTGAEGKKVS